jgi:hypothetical protein
VFASSKHLRLVPLLVVGSCLLPGAAWAGGTGGTSPGDRPEGSSASTTGKPGRARISHGKAIPPSNAPRKVRQIIAAANKIVTKPYVYGGGHSSWNSRGYDCSGSVSYALHGAGYLRHALTSGDFAHWASPGRGRWVAIYANSGHVYMYVAGLRFDTGYRDSRASSYGTHGGTGPRWNKSGRPARGYAVRHPRGL